MPFDAKPPHFWPFAEDFVLDKAKKLWHSFFEFARIYIEMIPRLEGWKGRNKT